MHRCYTHFGLFFIKCIISLTKPVLLVEYLLACQEKVTEGGSVSVIVYLAICVGVCRVLLIPFVRWFCGGSQPYTYITLVWLFQDLELNICALCSRRTVYMHKRKQKKKPGWIGASDTHTDLWYFVSVSAAGTSCYSVANSHIDWQLASLCFIHRHYLVGYASVPNKPYGFCGR